MRLPSLAHDEAPGQYITIPQYWLNKTKQHTPGHKSLVVNVVVVDPFEEEEEGTGIASDVVKVQGEDPAIAGYYLRSVDTRRP